MQTNLASSLSRKNCKMCKFSLTFEGYRSIILKLSRNAAIAQPVERILGKDEVASSNLASSSKKEPTPFGVGSFLLMMPDLKT